jgi:transcriptional regulator with XRE-family HTH domain
MAERRTVSSDVSAALVEYVLREKGLSQEQLADAIEVSPAFISRVRTGQRSFSIDHLAAFEWLMNVPLGALLLAAVPIPKPRPELKRLHELARQAIEQGDSTASAIRHSTLAGKP